MKGINRNKLKGLRVEKGLTQKDMAEKMSISEFSYNSKEQGKRNFTDIEIYILCEILKVKSDIFFDL